MCVMIGQGLFADRHYDEDPLKDILPISVSQMSLLVNMPDSTHLAVWAFGGFPSLGPRVVPFYPFSGEGSPTKTEYTTNQVPFF